MAEVAVEKVADSLYVVAKKQISYMWNFCESIENLKKEAGELSGMKGRVQQQIELANSKGERLLEGVAEWMTIADDKISKSLEFAKEAEAKKTCCNLNFCFNLGALYHNGKKATKKTSCLLEHQERGKVYETRVSLPPRTIEFTDLHQRKNLESIDTHKSTLNKIIQAVKDVQIVGIDGLGGVGKTTLACEAAVKMKNEFNCIEFITISQTVDAKTIKEKVEVAARKIINGDKVLIILDDVWEELKLDELGIPCGSDKKNCKILLTSRNKDVCEAMNAEKIISVHPLEEEEAWIIFESVVGKREWDNTWKTIALKIVQECSGLPLFIQAVGKALKNKEFKIWEAALGRLQDPTDEDTPFKRNGIVQLKLSYDYLQSEVDKSCFLLCSMFPEDGIISLKRLTYYALALGIFNNLNSIQDATHRVRLAVESLKSSFLLSPVDNYYISLRHEEEDEELYKMHDLVRDMALCITSKGNNKFLVQSGKGLTEWQPQINVIEGAKKISLMDNTICKLPDYELDLPHLDAFLIQNNKLSFIPDEFFRGMRKLKVLDMSGNNISSLPGSLKQLRILCSLDLSKNESLCEISILGELTCLVILKLRRTGITNIPKEIGQLTNLRLLDVYFCEDLSYVTPGVISKLTYLEECYIYVKNNKGGYQFLVELGESKSLKILHLVVPRLQYIPKDSHFETLIEFHIQEDLAEYQRPCYKRILQFSSCRFPFTKPIMKLIQVSEKLKLEDIKDLDNILPALYQEGFDELKHIELVGCDNVKSLVKTCALDAMQSVVTSNELGLTKTTGKFFSQVEEITLVRLNMLEFLWDSPHQYISFSKLVKISITTCSLLELFPLSVAKGLVNLNELDISDCESLMVVISAGDEHIAEGEIEMVKQNTDIVLPFTYIRLNYLPKLESFYSGQSTIIYPSLWYISVNNCVSMKKWSFGENHTPNIDIHHKGRPYITLNEYTAEMNGNFSAGYFSYGSYAAYAIEENPNACVIS
ncbi:putative P-loop containing nucleoside triphosphate hydrolase, leucine-rich repeat domain superfamily [Helianthus debilis subsp. tardiflorus]